MSGRTCWPSCPAPSPSSCSCSTSSCWRPSGPPSACSSSTGTRRRGTFRGIHLFLRSSAKTKSHLRIWMFFSNRKGVNITPVNFCKHSCVTAPLLCNFSKLKSAKNFLTCAISCSCKKTVRYRDLKKNKTLCRE